MSPRLLAYPPTIKSCWAVVEVKIPSIGVIKLDWALRKDVIFLCDILLEIHTRLGIAILIAGSQLKEAIFGVLLQPTRWCIFHSGSKRPRIARQNYDAELIRKHCWYKGRAYLFDGRHKNASSHINQTGVSSSADPEALESGVRGICLEIEVIVPSKCFEKDFNFPEWKIPTF